MSDHDPGGPILLACEAPGCSVRAHAQLAHLENLLAPGAWSCPEHRKKEAA